MEQPNISQVERLIEELYSSSHTTDTKQYIQEQLQNLQKQPFAWGIASQLLSSQSDQCRFFGAHTFQVKITRDWNTLPEDSIEWLKEELLDWIVRLCGGPQFVLRKLCLALIAYALHTAPDQWPHFIKATAESVRSRSQANGISPKVIELSILEFFTLVPEEITNANMIGGRKLQLIRELRESTSLVVSTLSAFLSDGLAGHEIYQKSLKCLQSWIQYGFDFDIAHPILERVITLLVDEYLFEPAVEVLLESMQQSTWVKYHKYRDELLLCFTSEPIKNKCKTSIAERDEETAKLFTKLFTAFGETYTEYIATQLFSSDVEALIDMILQLTGFEGYFPIDQEVTDIPLNFWYIFQETLFDECVLPVCNVNATDGENDVGEIEKRVWKSNCGNRAIDIYRKLVHVLIKNACYPHEEEWNSWNKNTKDKFKIWRRDLGDTMINPYYILREDMLSILFEQTVHILNEWKTNSASSNYLEAVLFCLKSISEEIPPKENAYIARIFGPEVLGRLPDDCSVRSKNTILLLMGSLAEWLKVHPGLLGNFMDFIVRCLTDPQLAPAACSAFANICDICRESLINDLERLMEVYAAMSNLHIKSNIMQKVVESVADVIQVLPPDIAIAPLMSLTMDILQGISNALNSIGENPEAARDSLLVQLQYLSACCRGIQSPKDDYQSLIERNTIYDAFANGELAASYKSVNGFNEIASAITDSSTQIARLWSSDEQIAKALSHFLELGMRSTSPLLSLSFSDLVLLVQSCYNGHPFPCWLDTASFIMTVYGGQTKYSGSLRDLLGLLTEKTFNSVNTAEMMEECPDVVDSYFGLLSRSITRCPMAFYELTPDMRNTIFMFTITGMGLQERLALKAALNFMADFVSQYNQENSEISRIVDEMMMNMGMQIMEQLLLGIGGRVPRSFSGPLVDVLYKIIGKHLQPSRQWLQILLATDGFPSTLITPVDKETFCKGVLGTKSLKRFKETANTFSIKCRGLGNTSFGKV